MVERVSLQYFSKKIYGVERRDMNLLTECKLNSYFYYIDEKAEEIFYSMVKQQAKKM